MKASTKVILVTLLAAAASGLAEPPDAQVEPGRRLYELGLGQSGEPVMAVLESVHPGSGSATEIPATALPCVGCHGPDGRGQPEGGLRPSDIRWSTLSTALKLRGSPERPAYDSLTWIRAVSLGYDSAGRRLQTAMPRYRLSQADAAALRAYLKSLDRPSTPGVDDRQITFGLQIPAGPPERAEALAALVRAWAADISGAGGVYRRRVVARKPAETNGSMLAMLVAGPDPGDPAPLDAATPEIYLWNLGGRDSPSINTHYRWQRLSRSHRLSSGFRNEQLDTLRGLERLTSALEAAGRRLNRAALLGAISARSVFATGLESNRPLQRPSPVFRPTPVRPSE